MKPPPGLWALYKDPRWQGTEGRAQEVSGILLPLASAGISEDSGFVMGECVWGWVAPGHGLLRKWGN